mmetsp:Transcript_20689/g.51834  ORF Transcript_20689/g.51834 Transcript_20689/m.51834 type:complete len:343 (-) Transcript_20689:680-1708(-)
MPLRRRACWSSTSHSLTCMSVSTKRRVGRSCPTTTAGLLECKKQSMRATARVQEHACCTSTPRSAKSATLPSERYSWIVTISPVASEGRHVPMWSARLGCLSGQASSPSSSRATSGVSSCPTRRLRVRMMALVPRQRPILTMPKASVLSVSPMVTSLRGTSHADCASTSLSNLESDDDLATSLPAKSLRIFTPGMRRSSPELQRVSSFCLAGLPVFNAYVSGGRSGGLPAKVASPHPRFGLPTLEGPSSLCGLMSENLGGRSECGESFGDTLSECAPASGVSRSVSSQSSSAVGIAGGMQPAFFTAARWRPFAEILCDLKGEKSPPGRAGISSGSDVALNDP